MTEQALTNELGYVDAEGRVYLGHGDEAKLLGQLPGKSAEEALAYFTRKFDALSSSIGLAEQRIEQHGASAKDIANSVKSLKETLAQGKAFGNIARLETRLAGVEEKLAALESVEKKQRQEQIAAAQAYREEIVVTIENICAQDPAKTQWKSSTESIQQAFEAWKVAQKQGPRIPKAEEDALWNRIKKARQVFDKNRREFYAQHNAKQNEAKKVKQDLIAKAEQLSQSEDFAKTPREYKNLMEEWKRSPRVSRKEDEKLWEQFRAAQQTFFDKKQSAADAMDEELAGNVEGKLAVLAEAEALLPIKNLEESRKKLKDIVARYEAAGMVPRSQQRDIENRMHAVEKAHKDLEDKQWRDNDPEKNARSNSLVQQLEESIEKLTGQIASETNDAKKQKLQNELETKQSWLAMLT